MPTGFQVIGTGTVTPSGDQVGTLLAPVANPADPGATLLAAVDDLAVAAGSSVSTWRYARVRLGDEWIPEEDLVGPIVYRSGIDRPYSELEFGVHGERYSIFSTEKTWTRTPIELHAWRGASPSAMQPEAPLLTGFVLTCDQDDDREAVVQIRAGDDGVLLSTGARSKACFELAPFAGRTRDRIVADILAGHGITAIEAPRGAVYDRPVQAVNTPVMDLVRSFVEPELWVPRWLPGGGLRLEEVELKRPPRQPDDVWTPDRWFSIRLQPPRPEASRWILRGTRGFLRGSVTTSEVAGLGLEVTRTETEVVAPFAPTVALQRQLTDGSLVPSGLSSEPTTERVIQRVVDVETRRAGELVERVVEEYGWRNLAHARQVTLPGSGYGFVEAWVDEDGQFVLWPRQKFLRLQRMRVVPSYDAEGTPTGEEVTIERWHRVPKAVAAAGGNPAAPTVQAWVHGDDVSYETDREVWGLAERQEVELEYDPVSGAQERRISRVETFFSPREAVGTGHPLFGGQAHADSRWLFQLTEERLETSTIRDGKVAGKTAVVSGWQELPEKFDGLHDFGGGLRSNQPRQTFGLIQGRSESKRFDQVSEEQVETVTLRAGQAPESDTLLGGTPVPLHLQSVWTRLVLQQIEAVTDDETWEAWWGFDRRVLQHEFVQSSEEAFRLLEHRRRRAAARGATVEMPAAHVRDGSTVRLIDPGHGLDHLGLIVDQERRWDLQRGEELGVYQLEVEA